MLIEPNVTATMDSFHITGWEINQPKIQEPSSTSVKFLAVQWCQHVEVIFIRQNIKCLCLAFPTKNEAWCTVSLLDSGNSILLTWLSYSGPEQMTWKDTSSEETVLQQIQAPVQAALPLGP